jgi:hypothetical protein
LSTSGDLKRFNATVSVGDFVASTLFDDLKSEPDEQ